MVSMLEASKLCS